MSRIHDYALFPWLRIKHAWDCWILGCYWDVKSKIVFLHFFCFTAIINYRYSFYVGNVLDGPEEDAVLFVWNLVCFRGHRLDLHWIKKSDRRNFYHSHPARAYRIILARGYVEQKVYRGGIDPHTICDGTTFLSWRPGCRGWVEPDYIHRIDYVPKGGSWSLWFRGRITHEIKVGGFVNGRFLFEEDGWIKEL